MDFGIQCLCGAAGGQCQQEMNWRGNGTAAHCSICHYWPPHLADQKMILLITAAAAVAYNINIDPCVLEHSCAIMPTHVEEIVAYMPCDQTILN